MHACMCVFVIKSTVFPRLMDHARIIDHAQIVDPPRGLTEK